jgi:hypothetical protein
VPPGLAVTTATLATRITPTATLGASAVRIIDPTGAVAVTTAGIIGAVGVADGITDTDGVAVAGLIESNLSVSGRKRLRAPIIPRVTATLFQGSGMK